jgi:hypothetical protein
MAAAGLAALACGCVDEMNPGRCPESRGHAVVTPASVAVSSRSATLLFVPGTAVFGEPAGPADPAALGIEVYLTEAAADGGTAFTTRLTFGWGVAKDSDARGRIDNPIIASARTLQFDLDVSGLPPGSVQANVWSAAEDDDGCQPGASGMLDLTP